MAPFLPTPRIEKSGDTYLLNYNVPTSIGRVKTFYRNFRMMVRGLSHIYKENRARDLFYAMWMPDLFMERVKDNGNWSLFCPNETPGLSDAYGEEFRALYTRYEQEGRARKTISAQALWFSILESQIETGTPYILYKDAANLKSNQKNLGTIKSSNLSTEIMEYTSKGEVAVCNLASLALNKFVIDGAFDFQKLHEITRVVTRNLNKVIDVNYYPIIEAQNSNRRHRPIGIGVQGLADAFIHLRMPFDSPEARPNAGMEYHPCLG